MSGSVVGIVSYEGSRCEAIRPMPINRSGGVIQKRGPKGHGPGRQVGAAAIKLGGRDAKICTNNRRA